MDAVGPRGFAEADHCEPTRGDEPADGLCGHAEPFGCLGYRQQHAHTPTALDLRPRPRERAAGVMRLWCDISAALSVGMFRGVV